MRERCSYLHRDDFTLEQARLMCFERLGVRVRCESVLVLSRDLEDFGDLGSRTEDQGELTTGLEGDTHVLRGNTHRKENILDLFALQDVFTHLRCQCWVVLAS